jgi:hypothetical protein
MTLTTMTGPLLSKCARQVLRVTLSPVLADSIIGCYAPQDLKTFMESILSIDEELVNAYVQTLTLNTLQTYQNGATISWQEVELAVHLVYLYGELHKGAKGFCGDVAIFVSV